MKNKRNLLISSILGLIIGWALGFLRLPFLAKNYAFALGFITCLAFIALLLLLFSIWNKHTSLKNIITSNSSTSDATVIQKIYGNLWGTFLILLAIGGLICGFLMYQQKGQFKEQTVELSEKMEGQTELIETIKNNNLVLLTSVFSSKIEDELRRSKGSLSETTIGKIAKLSHSFKPYQHEEDSLSINKLSPERAELLLSLANMEMDSNSFNRIKHSTTFASADLRKADLSGLDLNGVDLEEARLWGANLNGAKLSKANLHGADLRWANLNGADLTFANLKGSNLANSKLIKADFSEALLKWAVMEGAILHQANFTKSNLLGAELIKANFSETNLTEANLYGVYAEKDWFENLTEQQIIGIKEIQAAYFLKEYKTPLSLHGKFYLKKKAEEK